MLEITLDQPGRFSRGEGPSPRRGAGEAIVRVHRIGVCGTDLHAFAGSQPFIVYPRILGHELGVEIVEIEPNDRGLKAGDRCAVEPYLTCGNCVACRAGKTNCCTTLQCLGVHTDGGMRPLITIPIAKLHISRKLSLDQLALVETLAIGAHAVERAAPGSPAPGSRGERTLVIGAGPIGLSVIQFLQVEGADITVMDTNAQRLAFCRDQLGVTRTITDPAALGEPPTLILDATGHRGSMENTFNLIAHGGRIVFVGLLKANITFDDGNFHRREQTIMSSRNATAGTFTRVINLIEAGRIDTTPWITHRMALSAVPDSFPQLPGAPGLVKAMIEV